ncbi:MAG: response regulator [Pseudobdellovibrionaceae bacterium]
MNLTKQLKILVIDDLEDIQELVIFMVQSKFKATIETCSSGNQAIERLKKEPSFDLIISDYQMPDGNGLEVLKFLRSQNRATPFLFLSGNDLKLEAQLELSLDWKQVPKPFSEEILLSAVNQALSAAITEMDSKYIPVRLKLLEKMGKLQAPLFVKINEQKMVQLTSDESDFTPQMAQKYRDKRVESFFIRGIHIEQFIHEFQKKVSSEEAWKSVDVDDLPEVFSMNVELMRDISSKLGWSEPTLKLAEESLLRALAIIARQPSLDRFIQRFQKIERLGYADHCVLTALTAVGILRNLDSQNEDSIKKLVFASIFHDATLNDDQYDNKKKFLKSILKGDKDSSKDLRDVFAHTLKSAELCRQWVFCPSGVEEVIIDHHENGSSTGFPNQKTADQISELAKIFIIAEDFVQFFTEFNGKAPLKDYKRLRQDQFPHQSFQRIIHSLLKDVPEDQVA